MSAMRMSATLLPVVILAPLAVLLYCAIAIVLVRTYRRTRDVGVAWLFAAVIAWPILASSPWLNGSF